MTGLLVAGVVVLAAVTFTAGYVTAARRAHLLVARLDETARREFARKVRAAIHVERSRG